MNPIEIIALIYGHARINEDEFSIEINGSANIEIEGYKDYNITCSITTNDVTYTGDFLENSHVKLEEVKVLNEYNLLGTVSLEEDNNITNSIEEVEINDKVITLANTELVGHINYISGIDKEIVVDRLVEDGKIIEVYNNEIYGIVKYEEDKVENSNNVIKEVIIDNSNTKIYNNEVLGHLSIKETRVEHNEDLKYTKINDTTYVFSNEILGKVNIEKYRIFASLINGNLSYEESNLDDKEEDIINKIDEYEDSDSNIIEVYNNEIVGHINYTQDRLVRDIYSNFELAITGTIDKNNISNIINEDGNEITIQHSNEIYGSVSLDITNIENDNKKIDEYEDSDSNIIEVYNNEIVGHMRVPYYYKAYEFGCKITTQLLEHSIDIDSSIIIPPSRYYTIPCRIEIITPNRESLDLIQGSVSLEGYEKYNGDKIIDSINIDNKDISIYENEILGKVSYKQGISVDVEGKAYIDAIHTRKEIECSIDVVIGYHYDINCDIEVSLDDRVLEQLKNEANNIKWEIVPKEYWINWEYDTIEMIRLKILEAKRYIHDKEKILIPRGEYPIDDIDCTFEPRRENRVHIKIEKNKVIEEKKDKVIKKIDKRDTNIPKGKIVIVVSPTWSYEPFVLKGSLVTFLDRYYRKADISIVFGGNPRADFDIINLALNYKIRASNLLQIPIEIDPKNPFIGHNSVNHFIEHMNEWQKDKPILRVFMFMNQPNWYYNDPLANLANYCRDNGISCVGISAGGEWHEILEYERYIDNLESNLEFDRQRRFYPNKYIENITLPPIDPNRIVY